MSGLSRFVQLSSVNVRTFMVRWVKSGWV